MKTSIKRAIANRLCSLFPATRCYNTKRKIWNWADVQIEDNARLVSSVRIYTNGPVSIGKNSFIGHETLIVGGDAAITIGNDCSIGPRCMLVTGTHDITPEENSIAGAGKSEPITIGNGVWLGANVTIIAGTTIADKSILAAGAVANKDTETRSISAGVPAKKIKQL